MSKNIIQYLKARGFVDALTSDEIEKICEKPIKVYVGFDPTADSLHLGNLFGIMALAHFQRFGHTPVVILGGATGHIGDPSEKSQERPLLDTDTILNNVHAIRLHFEQILNFDGKLPTPIILNNGDWYRKFGLIDFLRDVGKHFRIGPMLAKDSVRTRLNSEEGMSYTEFSYQLMQGYDFFHLHTEHEVLLQMGGSDQWGNITAGIEYTRKLTGRTVYGLTWPLLTRSDGKKFGKSEGGSIWLSAKKCSPYDFYQYLFRIPDADVIHMMKMLTFMEIEEIEEIEKQMEGVGYVPNTAQKRLAQEVTLIVHGKDGLEKAQAITAGAAPGKETELSIDVLEKLAKELPTKALGEDAVLGMRYPDLAVSVGLLPSKGEATRLIKNGGAYLNNEKIDDPTFEIQKKHLIGGKFLLLGAGKKKKALIKIK